MAGTPIASASPAASVGSPTPYPTLAPSIAPAAPSPPEASSTPAIVTQKEWVIPPRPKPGRKPATDTPPTKRKAQNRAAQRAFRERRAARVNELEEKLKQVAEETSAATANYVAQIAALTKTNSELVLANAAYQKQVEELQERVKLLESSGNGGSGQVEQQVASPAPSSDHDDLTMPVSLPSPRGSTAGIPSGCCRGGGGKAGGSSGGGCPCRPAASSTSSTAAKRPTSPTSSDCSKRRRYDFLETDFTTAFSSRAVTVPINLSRKRAARPPPDPCGFCSEGTPCVCAEVANAMDMEPSDNESAHDQPMSSSNDDDEEASFTIPNTTSPMASPMHSHRSLDLSSSLQLAPLLTDLDDFRGQQILPNITPSSSSSSTNNNSKKSNARSGCSPGNCAQCRSDPMLTLFCQSVVSNKVLDIETPPPAAAALVSLRSSTPSTSSASSSLPSPGAALQGTYIPCSAAYQTLSRHRGFDEAAADLGSLVRPLIVERGEGGCPRVEVSSVRDVLKMLDRRFGRGTEG